MTLLGMANREIERLQAENTRLRTEVAALSEPVGDEAVREAAEFGGLRDMEHFDTPAAFIESAFAGMMHKANTRDSEFGISNVAYYADLIKAVARHAATLTRALTTAQRDKERMEAVVEAARTLATADTEGMTAVENAEQWDALAVALATLDSKEA